MRCGAATTGCTPSVSASSEPVQLNPLALLASQGVPLAFGSDTPGHRHESLGDRARRDPAPARRAARCRRARRSRRPPAAHGGRAGCATVSPAPWCRARPRRTRCGTTDAARGQRARRRGAALVDRPAIAGTRAAPARPRRPAAALPCRRFTGVPSSMAEAMRDWSRADDDTDALPVLTADQVDEQASDDETGPGVPAPPTKRPTRLTTRRRRQSRPLPSGNARMGQAVRRRGGGPADAAGRRHPRRDGCSASASRRSAGGTAAILAFALLAWVLTRDATTLAGGFGYGFLFGLAFYIPLLPWIRRSGRAAAVAGAVAHAGAVPRAVRAGRRARAAAARLADLVRRPVGADRMAEVDGAVRRIPLGCRRFRPDRRPAAAARAARRRAAGVVRGGAGRVQPRRDRSLEVVTLVAAQRRTTRRHAPPAVVLPGVVHQRSCCSPIALVVARGPAVRCRRGRRAVDHRRRVQGNVPRLGLEFNAQRRAVLDNHVRETMRLAEDVRAGRAPQPAVRHLAGELLGHRPARQPRRRRPDRASPPTRSARRSSSAACWPRPATPATTRCRRTR